MISTISQECTDMFYHDINITSSHRPALVIDARNDLELISTNFKRRPRPLCLFPFS